MLAQIKHAAIYTQNPKTTIPFYEKILGMRRSTTAVLETNRGHLSDGLIGLAVLARRPGIPAGLDHFGFEVTDIETVLDRIRTKFPETTITKGLEKVPFAVFRSHDPAGAQFDISQRSHEKVREGYKEDAGFSRASSIMWSFAPPTPNRSRIFIRKFSSFLK